MDLLQSLPRNEESDILRLQKLYARFGYDKFRMSKFEDYALYLQNKDFLKGGSIITFNGPDGRLLALKQDITLSIVKNAQDDKTPCKVYYTENVYRASDDANDIREIPQAGVEYIGKVDVYAMSEVIRLAIESLAAVSDRYLLGLSHMGLVRGLLDAAGLSTDLRRQIVACIQNKAAHELHALCKENGVPAAVEEKLCALSTVFGRPEDCFDALSELVVNDRTADAVRELRDIYSLLCETGNGDCVRIDFSVANDMQYYNGITFQGFVDGTPRSVLSGGRYDELLRQFGRKSGAIGFAVYLDLLPYSRDDSSDSADILVLYDPSDVRGLAAAVQSLQQNGSRVRVQTAQSDGQVFSKVYVYREGRLTTA
ncbi:MAG: ATP phosphoribosyltransferase regulatory subunit [Clostridia bacterium]|nr:ATP phosphoribosyltransferase regulatory subunit [Clostridia bacterium]